jgi:methionyl aminopeptidase
MIAIRTNREIELLRRANQIVAETHVALEEKVRPGVKTKELDAIAEEMILAAGGTPAFKGYQGFPASTCISVDEVIVHGIPGNRELQEGEIVSIDIGVNYKGYIGDAALSMPCGQVDEERSRLLETTERALAAGIAAARAGNYRQAISRAIEAEVVKEHFAIVRDFVGHGVGTSMHEDPQIPNFDDGQKGPLLKPGMVLAIEPMVNAGTEEVKVLSDKWTAVTADGRPSAHFEHSIVITEGEADILSLSAKRPWSVPAHA